MDRQCSSCGGFCKKSGCERENVKPEKEKEKEKEKIAYQKEYADAMGWKIQNHLEHLPPKKEWVGLTDEEIEKIWGEPVDCMFSGTYKGIRAIEAKLKEKNNA